MNWEETLTDIFAAYVNQQTLEEGADQMAFVSSDNLEFHRKFLEAIDKGLGSMKANFLLIISIINKSGYHVDNEEAATCLLKELRRFYLERYKQMLT